MNIIVPMAGRGTRFTGHSDLPKPLIPVSGKPMIEWALESIRSIPHKQIFFIVLKEHEERYGVHQILTKILGYQPLITFIDQVTEGQLCTVLACAESLSSDEDILIASADTYIVSDLGNDIVNRKSNIHGLISVSKLKGDRWSFARTDGTTRVVEVAEKKRISDYASTGLYYFSNGQEFRTVATNMINNNEKTNGEYYIIPVYQKYIEFGWRVDISNAIEVWDMGTPNSKEVFEAYINK